MAGRILVGTAGYSYRDWIGPVYPFGTAARDFLPLYARRFSTVELNVTFYRPPTPDFMAGIVAKAGPAMVFSVKAHRSLTHEPQAVEAAGRSFRQGLRPLIEAGRLGAVLVQLPWSFRPSNEAWRHLERLHQGLTGLPVVAELRHADWWSPPTLARLTELGWGFCNVDLPRLDGLPPPSAHATSRIGYVRLHGRNAARWWRHQAAHERYDYRYRPDELEPWARRIRALADRTEVVFVFANNHYRGKAVETAEALIDLLGAERGTGGPRQCNLFPP